MNAYVIVAVLAVSHVAGFATGWLLGYSARRLHTYAEGFAHGYDELTRGVKEEYLIKEYRLAIERRRRHRFPAWFASEEPAPPERKDDVT